LGLSHKINLKLCQKISFAVKHLFTIFADKINFLENKVKNQGKNMIFRNNDEKYTFWQKWVKNAQEAERSIFSP